ncbi:iron ABC transporter permease [Gordonia sp. MP11Mi]|uniref:Petrobactin import system permease protein FpuB n=1 Tax=Gordonia sp. MP11Mi TaxID=3022769 RepID=A0AA97CU12_9ACTN
MQTLTSTETKSPSPTGVRRPSGVVVFTVLLLLWVGVIAVVHLCQGSADLSVATLWNALWGGGLPQSSAILLTSRVPRLLAGLLVGAALGMAGAALQSVTRNPLASPETIGVGAGSYLVLTIAAACGVTSDTWIGLLIAFAGGLCAAAAVLGVTGQKADVLRVVLAGSALTMALSSVTSVILLLNTWQTQGLFVWGAGSLGQNGLSGVATMIPVAAVAACGLVALGRRLDLLQLGDDAAASYGVPVTSTRYIVLLLAVLLTASAITVTGPIGFVGLCAPALMRLLSYRITGLRRQRVFLATAALTGMALVLTADVALRAVVGAVNGIGIPTGVLTSLIGAVFLVVLARRLRGGGGHGESIASLRAGVVSPRYGARVLVVIGAAIVLVVALVAALLLGDTTLLLGDIWNWCRGVASVRVDLIVETRLPRIAGALLAGTALGMAGLFVQTITRNPLADPGILGVSASAGVGAVSVITLVSSPSDPVIYLAATAGAVVALFLLVVLGRSHQTQLILVGVALGAGAGAVTTLLLIRSDPWNQTRAMTWLGGSTYSTTFTQLAPLLVLIVVGALVAVRTRRDLDVLQFDDTTPRVLGVSVPRSRLVHIGLAALLTAAATAAVGVFAFVGLMAPHAARLLVGKRHMLVMPLTMVLGAIIVVVADIIGRALFAPTQLPAGLVVAIVGAPYFLFLLRSAKSVG